MTLRNSITAKITEIKNILIDQNNNGQFPIGMVNGSQGDILFLLNYHKQFKDEKSLEHALNLLENIFHNLDDSDFSFSTGLASLPWLIQYINKNDFAEIESDILFEDLDKSMFDWMVSCCENGNFDYLHGAVGAGLYFFYREDSNFKHEALDYLINSLLEQSEGNSQEIKWTNFDFKKNKKRHKVFNFGLSHGIPGILVFLSMLYDKYPSYKHLKRTVSRGLEFLMNNQEKPINRGSYFLNNSLEEESFTSRLAWCYGDIGTAYALWYCSSIVGEPKVMDKAEEILLHNTIRKDCQSNSVYDAGFCHGSSGVAHIYNKVYKLTLNTVYKQASEHWFTETLKFANFYDGLAGFKSYSPTKMEYTKNASYLEGIAGIGLSMISFLDGDILSWDEPLLLYNPNRI
jgi:lantibiotic modifying enzyme